MKKGLALSHLFSHHRGKNFIIKIKTQVQYNTVISCVFFCKFNTIGDISMATRGKTCFSDRPHPWPNSYYYIQLITCIFNLF